MQLEKPCPDLRRAGSTPHRTVIRGRRQEKWSAALEDDEHQPESRHLMLTINPRSDHLLSPKELGQRLGIPTRSGGRRFTRPFDRDQTDSFPTLMDEDVCSWLLYFLRLRAAGRRALFDEAKILSPANPYENFRPAAAGPLRSVAGRHIAKVRFEKIQWAVRSPARRSKAPGSVGE